jgi:hypothetical protein
MRSQRRFESSRCALRKRAWRPGSTRVRERVFVSDQTVASASIVSISCTCTGEICVSWSSLPSSRRISRSPSTDKVE